MFGKVYLFDRCIVLMIHWYILFFLIGKTTQMQSQQDRLSQELNELKSTNMQLDVDVQQLSSKLQSTELELKRLRTEGQSEYKIKVSSLEQQLADKDTLLSKMSALLEASKSQKVLNIILLNDYNISILFYPRPFIIISDHYYSILSFYPRIIWRILSKYTNPPTLNSKRK